MSVIVPTILTNDIIKAQAQLEAVSALVDLVQIDLMDGSFVDDVSITPEEIRQLQPAIMLEAHLMVSNPSAWLPYLDPDIFKRVYFHVEAVPKPADLISMIKEAGIEPGLAINVETPLDAIEDYIETIDSVLFMSVRPGRQNQEFQPQALEKIRAFFNQHPDHMVAIDGGVNTDNIEQVMKAGVDNISVGSAIFGAGDCTENIAALREIIS